MIYKVTPRFRLGRALSHQEIQSAQSATGDMVVVNEMSDYLNRSSSIARFQIAAMNERQPFPDLHDVTLSWMGPNGFVLTGFEIVSGIAYMQSWWCRSPNN
jgi:hypothetical protein